VKLEFDKQDQASAMTSAEGETVPLKNYQSRGGEVEEWLKSLSDCMQVSLKQVIRDAT
jgi:hypothetical protein